MNFKTYDMREQEKLLQYKLLIGSVLPRPIAFVTTMNSEGKTNAAPFSFFNIVSVDPPMFGIAFMRKPGGIQKDTAQNICQTGEFVIHVVDEKNLDVIHKTSADLPPSQSEIDWIGFNTIPSVRVRPPRIAECKIQIECKLDQVIHFGASPDEPTTDFIIGEALMCHIDEEILFGNSKIDTKKLDPVSRLAGMAYGGLGKIIEKADPYDDPEELKKKI
ncbi:flavin reductase family protein [Priestia megaterium]